MLKFAYVLFFIAGVVALFDLNPDIFIRVSLALAMIGGLFVGLHGYKHADRLAEQNKSMKVFFKLTPVFIPLAIYLVWWVFK